MNDNNNNDNNGGDEDIEIDVKVDNNKLPGILLYKKYVQANIVSFH